MNRRSFVQYLGGLPLVGLFVPKQVDVKNPCLEFSGRNSEELLRLIEAESRSSFEDLAAYSALFRPGPLGYLVRPVG